jgi:hypothetical protein
MTGRAQTLPLVAGGRRGKNDVNKILALLVISIVISISILSSFTISMTILVPGCPSKNWWVE